MSMPAAEPHYLAKYPFAWRTAAVALALTLALLWIVSGRVSLLSSGQEVVLQTVPVDPRDLLRGDYVILRYDISRK